MELKRSSQQIERTKILETLSKIYGKTEYSGRKATWKEIQKAKSNEEVAACMNPYFYTYGEADKRPYRIPNSYYLKGLYEIDRKIILAEWESEQIQILML